VRRARDLAAQLGFALIPTVVTIGSQSYLDDDVQLTRDEFYRRLPALNPLADHFGCPWG
jgi:fatty acid-binding protein DegV